MSSQRKTAADRLVIPLPILGSVLVVTLLAVVAALVVQMARSTADQHERRAKTKAQGVAATLGQHLKDDADVLTVLASIEARHGPDALQAAAASLVPTQTHTVLLGRVEPDGRVSLVLPAPGTDRDADLVRRAADAVPTGFGPAFPCGEGHCIGVARPVRRSGAEAGAVVMVTSLNRWLEEMMRHVGVEGARFRLRGGDGDTLAAASWGPLETQRVGATVPLDPPGHGLRLEVEVPAGSPLWPLPALGLLSVALGLALVVALGALNAQLRQRQRAAARLEAVNEMLAAVARCESLFISGAPAPAVFEALLDAALRLTGSAFGLVGEVGREADGSPVLRSRAFSDIAWDEASRDFRHRLPGGELEFRNPATLLGALMRAGEAVIANDPARDSRAHGLPEGHPPLRSFAGIPLKHGGELVGAIGLANRPGGYDHETLRELDPLLTTAATLIEATRSSERRQVAERQLRLREGALEASANAIVLTDRDGVILWVNRAFSTLTGYSSADVVGATPRVLQSGVHPPDFFREMWIAIRRGDVWRGELTNRRKDGTLYVEEMTITPLRVGSDEISHFVAVKQDVAWRREAERRIRESEARFRGLVQSVDAIVWEAEPDGGAPDGVRLTFVSDRALQVLGYPREDWLAEPGFRSKRLHPGDAARVLDQWRRQVLDGEGGELDYRMRAADGRWVWCRDIVRTARDARGRPTRISGLLIDVTSSRQMEQALLNASEEWRATFDALDAPLLVLGEAGRIERLNRAAARLLGGDWKACLGRVPWEIRDEEPWVNARAALERDAPLPGLVRDGHGRTWDVGVFRPHSLGLGREARILALRDVTRMMELQDSARQAETWTILGSLVAGVAHEVRNPLFAMSVNIDALDAVLRDHPDIAELVRALRHERDRLGRLMEDLLDYGRPAPEIAPGPLEPVLVAALAHVAPLAASRGLSLAREGTVAGARVQLNADRLEEVFANLLENACQHSPNGAEVRLEVESHSQAARRWVRCRVRDRGPGFPPDALDRVFQPFFTRRKGGVGLGLAIVARYVAEHRGQVNVLNHPEGGAVVVVDLPLLDDGLSPLA